MLQSQTTVQLDNTIAEKLFFLSQKKGKDISEILKEIFHKTIMPVSIVNDKKRATADIIDSLKKNRPVLSNVNYRDLIYAGRKY